MRLTKMNIDRATTIVSEALAIVGGRRIEIVGSVRRGRENPGDVDLVCECVDPKQSCIDFYRRSFVGENNIEIHLASGSRIVTTVLDTTVEVWLSRPSQYGAVKLWSTGPREFNALLADRAHSLGYWLNEKGLWRPVTFEYLAGETEEQIFKAIGVERIEPEDRDDAILSFVDPVLPKPIEARNVSKGILSRLVDAWYTYPDGRKLFLCGGIRS